MAEDSKQKEKKIEATVSSVSGLEVDMQGLALALGLSLPTVRARIREGLPCLQQGGRGKAWRFNLPDCVKWHTDRAIQKTVGQVEDGETKAQLERRLLVARVKREEIGAAQALGEIVALEDVERVLCSMVVDVRQAMLALPERVALRVLAAADDTEVKELLEDEIHLALSGLAEEHALEEIASAET